jgi:hypothetical protein
MGAEAAQGWYRAPSESAWEGWARVQSSGTLISDGVPITPQGCGLYELSFFDSRLRRSLRMTPTSPRSW